MPDLFFADLVRETSTGTGIGALALGGATPGHRRFADAVPPGSRFHYAVAGVTHEQQWEVGEGEIADGALVRLAQLASSAEGAAVDFLPGLKIVTLTVASSWFAERDDRSGHAHAIDQIAGLQSALDARQPAGSYAPAAHDHASLAFAAGSAAAPSITFAPDGDTGLFRPGSNILGVASGGTERARFTSGGRLGLGTTEPLGGLHVRWNEFSSGPDVSAAVIVEGSYGGGMLFKDGLGYVGLWTSDYGATFNIALGSGGMVPAMQVSQDNLRPAMDAGASLGNAAQRWTQLYASSGTINTSDARAKHWIGPMAPEEMAAGRAILAELGFFQWLNAREAKGADAARLHYGVRAQNAFTIMTDHGLDWRHYGWCCHDQWQDDEGEHERFGIRPDQLALFLVSVLARQVAEHSAAVIEAPDAGA